MGKSKDLATGETRFVNTSGDTMTGNLGIGASPSQRLHVEGTGNQFILLNNSSTNDGMYLKAGTGASSIQTNGGSHVLNFFTSGTERMKIDSSGRVTMPSQPAFMVIMTSAPTLTGSGTTTLPWNSEIFDVGSNFNTSNYRFTAPVNGLYYMHLHFELHSDSSWTNSTWAYIGDYFVNGTRKTGADTWGHSGKYNLATNALILELNANDYVDVRAVPNSNTIRYSGDSAGAYFNSKWFGYLIG